MFPIVAYSQAHNWVYESIEFKFNDRLYSSLYVKKHYSCPTVKWEAVWVHKYPNNKSGGQRPNITTIEHKHFFIMHLINDVRPKIFVILSPAQDWGKTTV